MTVIGATYSCDTGLPSSAWLSCCCWERLTYCKGAMWPQVKHNTELAIATEDSTEVQLGNMHVHLST